MIPCVDSNLIMRPCLPGDHTMEVLGVIHSLVSAGKKLPILWIHRLEVSNAF